MDTEAEWDCRACGACCRDASDGRVLVDAGDLVRWKREGRQDILSELVDGHFGERAFPARSDGRCAHLGTSASENDCSIYPTRGASCRDLIAGSAQCREYRRAAGLPT